jgi:hypothetical protein
MLLHNYSGIGYSGIGYSGIGNSGIDYSGIGYSRVGYSGWLFRVKVSSEHYLKDHKL